MNITITKKENPGKLPETDELGFGKYFTDHMFLMDYSDTDGWHNARIVAFLGAFFHGHVAGQHVARRGRAALRR